jgi:hypothetical protein
MSGGEAAAWHSLSFAVENEAARLDVEAALGVRFRPHDSLYLGDSWRAELPDGESFLRLRLSGLPLQPVVSHPTKLARGGRVTGNRTQTDEPDDARGQPRARAFFHLGIFQLLVAAFAFYVAAADSRRLALLAGASPPSWGSAT